MSAIESVHRLAALAILVAQEAPKSINRYAYVRRELVEMIREEMGRLDVPAATPETPDAS